MAYDRWNSTYGSPPSGVSREQAASEDAARRFARRRALLMGLQGGLGAGVEAGGGFLRNLTRGLAGSLGGTLQASQMQHEEERQSIRDASEQRRYEENQARLMEALGLQRRGVDIDQQRADEAARHNRATEGGTAAEPSRIRELGFLEGRGVPNAIDRLFPPPRPEMNEPLVQVIGPDGTPVYVPRSGAVGMKPPRERSIIKGQERVALAYYNRAREAENSISTLEDKISNLSLPGQYQLRYAPNVLQSSDQQVYRQAQRAFTEARLRKESGAAIPNSEYINDSRTYFAQPGDSPETIRKKRAARQVVLKGLKFQAGGAYQEYYGDEASSPEASGGGSADEAVEEYERVNGKLVRVK